MKWLKEFIEDESGQTTTEYVLIMVVIFTLIMNFRRTFVGMMKRWLDRLGEEGDNMFENSGS